MELIKKMSKWYIFSYFTFREEYSQLYEFVNKKQLRIKNKGGKDNGKGGHLDAMMESDDEHDAYLQKVKAEGRERYEDDDDDDTDSDGKLN